MSNTALLGSYGGQGNSSLMFRNRVINGAMVIDQRNAGAAVTPIAGATYLVDRFALETSFASKLTFRQVSNTPTDTNYEANAAPSGFTHSLKISVASSYTPTATENSGLFQQIEGFNIADFAWGTAEAKPVSISFWIKGSVTGKYTIHVRNIGETRTFLSTITINAANTWEYKTITIPGCTDGTWLVNNQRGIFMSINLGAGANFKGTAGSWLTTAGTPKLQSSDSVDFVSQINGSTLYITGVQLEAETATPFERRPIGTELALCQRYLLRYSHDGSGSGGIATGYQTHTAGAVFTLQFPVSMRVKPALAATTVVDLDISDQVNFGTPATLTSVNAAFTSANMGFSMAANGAQFRPVTLFIRSNTTGFLQFNAEL